MARDNLVRLDVAVTIDDQSQYAFLTVSEQLAADAPNGRYFELDANSAQGDILLECSWRTGKDGDAPSDNEDASVSTYNSPTDNSRQEVSLYSPGEEVARCGLNYERLRAADGAASLLTVPMVTAWIADALGPGRACVQVNNIDAVGYASTKRNACADSSFDGYRDYEGAAVSPRYVEYVELADLKGLQDMRTAAFGIAVGVAAGFGTQIIGWAERRRRLRRASNASFFRSSRATRPRRPGHGATSVRRSHLRRPRNPWQ